MEEGRLEKKTWAMMPLSLTAVVLTFNERKHIERCIRSVQQVASRIIVVDSFSTDGTVDMARSLGADVYQNSWQNYASQFQWALENTNIKTDWTMRIDADEYLEDELADSVKNFVLHPDRHICAYFRRKIVFLGKPIRHGFFYPLLMLRLWRTGQGRIEAKWMDEHIIVSGGDTFVLRGDLVDDNLNNLAWWTTKHVGYARREAYDIILSSAGTGSRDDGKLAGQARIKRWLKVNVFLTLPAGIRGALYFHYRYILGLGFLDGKAGFYFCFLQAFWYRTFVDATLFEIEREARVRQMSSLEFLRSVGELE